MEQEQKDLIQGLRDMADWLASKEFIIDGTGFGSESVYLFCSGEGFLKNTPIMGSFKREFNDWSAQLVRSFGPCKFILHTSREAVCQKIEDGVQVLPAEPEKIIPAKPERIVPKYKFVCPESLLEKASSI